MRLLVKNIANTWSTGDVVTVNNDEHNFGAMEQKSKFISRYPVDDWPRQFVVVNVIDCDESHYDFLLDNSEDGQRKYYLEPQDSTSPFYKDLLEFAEVTISKETLESLIRYRG